MMLKINIFLLLIWCLNVACKPKYVSISLDAKWPSTPYLLEASEYLSSISQETFWMFVNDIADVDPKLIEEASDEDYYRFVQQRVSKHVTPVQLNLLELSLSLREFSPLLEMYNQMAQDSKPPENCDAFVIIGHKKTCDLNKISKWVDKAVSLNVQNATIYHFDHIYPGANARAFPVILYGELGTPSFKMFHSTLKELSHDKKIRYVLRHFVKVPSETKVRLSGYGVELDIKSTEYKAKDDTKVTDEHKDDFYEEDDDDDDEIQGFNFPKLRQSYPDLKNELREFKDHLKDSATELTPLKAWQYQDLSFQAAQYILSETGSSALTRLQDVSQKFPLAARSLVKIKTNNTFRNEVKRNQQWLESQMNISPGEAAMFINGHSVDMDVYDMMTIMDHLRSEGSLMEGLFSLGLQGKSLREMLKIDILQKDNYALDIRHSAVQYLNDLEKDGMYQGWPDSVQDLLRPHFPGMLRHIAKNIFHLVFIVDPMSELSRNLLKTAKSFYAHAVPLRIGVVLVGPKGREIDAHVDVRAALQRAFNYISLDSRPLNAFNFLTDLYDSFPGEITFDDLLQQFKKKFPDEDPENVFGDNDEYDDLRKLSASFIDETGLSDFPQVLVNGVFLKKEHLKEEKFEEAIITTILEATPEIQKAVYQGKLTDRVSVLDWLMKQDNVLHRINSRILAPGKTFLDFTQHIDPNLYNEPGTFALLNNADMTSVITANIKYVYKKAEQESTPGVTLWLVVDLEDNRCRKLLTAALKRLKSSVNLRLGIVFNPSDSNPDNAINDAVYVAIRDVEVTLAKNFINKLLKDENVEGLRDKSVKLRSIAVAGMNTNNYITAVKTLSLSYRRVHRSFAQNVLGFSAGDVGIIANGRVIGPLDADENFLVEDFTLLEKFMDQSSVKTIKSKLEELDHKQDVSDLVMKVSSLLWSKTRKQKRTDVRFASSKYSVLHIPSTPDSPAFSFDVIVDPASLAAQKVAPILLVLNKLFNMEIRVFMNCIDQLSDLPIKSFYHYVLEAKPTFKDGVQNAGPVAKFVEIPHKSLLTLKIKAPESWLVESVRSPYDLDNILLDEVERGITAEFELEYLLLEGHCSDAQSGQPPRGLQFILGTHDVPEQVNTIVMANLGYFQLKANPGVWMLQLREGRSKDIYTITGHEQTDTPEGSTNIIVAMSSFQSRVVRMKVEKKSDMKDKDLLRDSDEDDDEDSDAMDGGGLWDSISKSIGQSFKTKDTSNETLNIFSLASGHLYERLLRIMMISVLKQTQSKVKFWFLKNFLSPTFKHFIPHMAKKYGFQYELVQYKWPRWLHQQTVKQRIIWGYKILFLDVLFPLDIKKIIFVDADQVVRADLKELHDLDLGGAPYGYTPFCDSRTEMDGFRFWNSGYWKNHLAGRKYHISALYVVDLKKFRRIAAGDRLRGQYQGLSQDPNSLSNLDQDLPNNMIHQVGIKSLPQEWLWCETWCSDNSKTYAKTIDLCNNPLTKEPKLQAAMRILPEWKFYDYEIKKLWDVVYNTQTALNTEYEIPTSSDEQDSPSQSIRTEL